MLWGSIASAALILVVGATLAVSHWMGGSATGTVSIGKSTAASSTPALQPAPETVHADTHYFSTVLPAGFTIKRNEYAPNTPLTELAFNANSNQQTDQTVSITVGELPDGGISNLGDYMERSRNSTTYAPTTLPQAPIGAAAFRTTQGPAALTLIWPNGTHYAELNVSTDGGATTDQLEATYQQVMSTWQWK